MFILGWGRAAAAGGGGHRGSSQSRVSASTNHFLWFPPSLNEYKIYKVESIVFKVDFE